VPSGPWSDLALQRGLIESTLLIRAIADFKSPSALDTLWVGTCPEAGQLGRFMAERLFEISTGLKKSDAKARAATLRLLRALAAASLLVPLALFAFASWVSLRDTRTLADERISRSLDVMSEQALKEFQSITVAIDGVQRLLGNRSATEIAGDEPQLHGELVTINSALPEVQSIWIFGPDGRPQVITRNSPPPNLFYGDQDYFTVPREHPDGPYVGHLHSSVSGGQPYFTLDHARRDARGKFAGVIEMSLLPSDFSRFYGELTSSPGLGFALLLEDGTILARYPPLPGDVPMNAQVGIRRQITNHPNGGFYSVHSPIDDTDHRVGIRRVPDFPVYVAAFVQVPAIYKEWMTSMAVHLIFGIPATLLLFVLMLTILRRSQRLHAEIDQRLAAEETLRQAQRLDAIGQLTGGVAHDFNNLLTIILGNLETAKHQLGAWSDAAHVQVVRRIDNAMQGATRAATLTRRLLAFARQTPLNPCAIDVNRFLIGLSEFLQRAIGEDIDLEIVGAAGLWAAEADPTELEAALINLAVNARDAMPEGGKLTIETSNAYLDDTYCRQNGDLQPGQYVLIAVSDTGSGMQKELIDRAFEPFFTTKQSGQGTGLGLSQVYGFAKQLGGHVKIYSEVGEGTTVKMYLRRHFGAVTAAAEAPSEAAHGSPGECVLVVEDDADVLGYVVEALTALGYDVLRASGAEQALQLLQQYKTVSLLLTDVVMPGKNGRKLAEEAHALHPSLKVLYMTGYSRNAIVHQGRLDPGVELIQKPLTTEQLAAAVRKVLDKA
jgi:two-component system NtrC family sensor kinase